MNVGASTYTNKTPENCKGILKTLSCLFSFRKPTVPLIRLSGIIGKMPGKSSITFECLSQTIDKAFKVPSAVAVVIVINSPGGSPVQCSMIADKISSLSSKKDIPVFTFAEDIAASAGYWLLCSGRESYACNASIVGSIGVICAKFGLNEMIKKIGIERRIYSQGKCKALLDSFQPENKEHIKVIDMLQKDVFNDFKAYVLSKRENKLKLGEEELFDGSVWSGKRALELGLIDGIYSNYEELIHDKFGEKTKIIRMNKKAWILDKIRSSSSDKIFEVIQPTIELF